jgi:hypothetical protein
LRRELYRPGADRATLRAYLGAAEAEAERRREASAEGADAAVEPAAAATPLPADPTEALVPAVPDGRRPRRWRHIAVTAAIALAVSVVGVALLPGPAPRPAPRPTTTSTPVAVAPVQFDGLRGTRTLLVALPFRTFRVRVRLQCDRRAAYGWTALGADAQTQQFLPVLSHSGGNCSPSATYIGPLPGDISNLRIAVVVEGGPYTLTVEPL